MSGDRVTRAVVSIALPCWLACGPPPPPPAQPTAPAEARPEDFSAERASRHLEALAAIEPRPPGSEGTARARAYIVDALRELGIEAREQRSRIERRSGESVFETVNLFAAIEGDSPDAILLLAPYDSPSGSAAPDDAASGAALVLELARSLQARRPPYTVWLAFVEGDSLARGPDAVVDQLVGAGALVAGLGTEGLARVRVAVYFERVAGPDLRVARDLLSNRTWREAFWAAARRLGQTKAFPPEAPFESVEGGQRAFLAVGMRRAVAIVGASKAAEPPRSEAQPSEARAPARTAAEPPRSEAQPGEAPPNEAVQPAESGLAAVGAVSLEAVGAIVERLAKIDRFVESPVAASEPAGEPAPHTDAGAAP